MKILILKPSSLGDVVQAIPVLRLLKLHWPDSAIYWWVDSRLAPLLEGDPDLAGVIRFDRHAWKSLARGLEFWRTIRWMRDQMFDLVLDLQCLARSGIVAWVARGELLVGLDEPREGARGFYDLVVQRPSYHTHAVDWYLETLRALNVPVHRNFAWLPPRPEIAAEVKQKWNSTAQRLVLLQPGARWENKRWPVESYAELVRRLAASHPELHFAVLGSQAESELGAAIARVNAGRCLDLTGNISLPEMIEWIRASDVMISNDTGPMHAAAALDKPLVAIFGPTEPRRTGPYGRPESVVRIDLPCTPCMKPYCTYSKPMECLRGIAVETVLGRVEGLLHGR